ncbi:MAG: LysR substrate-binding domain-containing protein [Hyphomicrobiaceae bacterium]
MRILNLPIDLLRTFVTVVDLGGYTKAGVALGRTQPAVSLQMRRLEELLATRLINIEGRHLRLTGEGELLVTYARELLRLNDEAVANFERNQASSALRIGLPLDYAVAFLQTVVTDFSRANPNAEIEIRCELSSRVLDMLAGDEIDIAVAIIGRPGSPYLSRVWVEEPVWAVAEGKGVETRDPLPLVAHPEGCEYRQRMITALQATRRRWRIAYSSPGISGLQRAVEAGLGVSALTRGTMAPGMRVLGESDGFPPLEPIRIGLCYKHPRLSGPGLKLVDTIRTKLDQAGFCRAEDGWRERLQSGSGG